MKKGIVIFLVGFIVGVSVCFIGDIFNKQKNRQQQDGELVRMDSISRDLSLSAEQKALIANAIIDSVYSGKVTISDSDRNRIERSIDRLIDSLRESQAGKDKAREVK